MFTGEVSTKEDILKLVKDHFQNATPQELQSIVDAAISDRKRRAKEKQQSEFPSPQQTPHPDERSEEPGAEVEDADTDEEEPEAGTNNAPLFGTVDDAPETPT
jgi:hypothetical protein